MQAKHELSKENVMEAWYVCDLGKESVICHLASSTLIYYIT